MIEQTPLNEESAAESRRYIAILFTDLSDSTRLSAAMEAEIYAAMLDDVRRAFRAAVEARGGMVNQYQGDGLQAFFGHRAPSEHDGWHAVEAALEVHQRVRELRGRYGQEGATGLAVHSGIHAGPTLARRGDDVTGRLELFGAAPGIAKHLSDVAEADEVLASEETLGPSSHLFETGPPRRVALKGRVGPLVVRRILSRSPRRARFEAHAQRGLARFVGREEELARLDHLLAAARAGEARTAVLLAPAGLGKTRLAEEFLRHAARQGFTVLRGDCDTELSAEPLQPFLQMLRAHLQVAPDATAPVVLQALETRLVSMDPVLADFRTELQQALSLVPQDAAAPRRTAEQMVRALHRAVTSLAKVSPLVLFVDDWHWADDATRELLDLLRHAGAVPLLLLLAARPPAPEVGQPGDGEVIELLPFSEHEAQAALAELLPGADPFVATQIARQAGGNALFLEELCHFAASAAGAAALRPVQGGPAWLESLIAARISRLAEGQRKVIDCAAVIGNLVPAWLLEGLTGCAVAHRDVQALAVQDLLYPAEEPGMLRFKHGITRDVTYGAIGLQTRRAAHRRAAALLAASSDAGAEAQVCEALAYHHAGAGEYERAAHYAAMAGDKAMGTSAIDRARAQYRAALDLIDRLSPSAEGYQAWRSVVRRLGLASVFDPARADLPVFDRAVAMARDHGDAPGLAFASYWLAYVSYALGESRDAVERGATALAAAEAAGDLRLRLQVRLLQGQALAACGQAAAAETLLNEALEDAEAGRRHAPPTPGPAYALACRASLLGDRGLLDEALADFARALEALPGPGHEVEGSVLCLRCNVHLWHGRWDDAAADASAAQRVAERVRSLYLVAMSRALGAWADWQRRGELHALDRLAEATAWLVARDKRLFVSLNHGRLAEALASVGQAEVGRGHAAAALQRWRRGDPLGAPMALRALARLAAAEGHLKRAARRMTLAERACAVRDSAHERAANARCRAELGLAPGPADLRQPPPADRQPRA